MAAYMKGSMIAWTATPNAFLPISGVLPKIQLTSGLLD